MSKKLIEGEINSFTYTKGNGEQSERTVLVASLPYSVTNVKTIDVSSLSEHEQEVIKEKYKQYQKYRKEQMDNIKSFEEYSGDKVQWKAFKESGIS